MAGIVHKLKVSEEIAATTAVCDELTPASGKSITVLKFEGGAAFTQNSVVRLMWDHEGVGEECIWSIKGESTLPHQAVVDAVDVDGVKKLALCCDNGESGAVWMSGYAEVLIE